MKKTGLNRVISDKYYTNQIVVEECMNIWKKYIKVSDNDLCIEPSAGNGSFITNIKEIFINYIFCDIEPEHEEILKLDYLQFEIDDFEKNKYDKIHVLGNPPFGRQSSTAIKFIKKSTQYCDSISFILPRSFKKESFKKHFPKNFHLVFEKDLPDNSFIIDNMKHDVPCVFQIWIKKNFERVIVEKIFPIKFKFVKKSDNHDISFRRVGVNAGEIDKNTINKSFQSHYFIKFEMELDQELWNKLSNINFSEKDYTVGPRSISKPELIKEFNIILNNI